MKDREFNKTRQVLSAAKCPKCNTKYLDYESNSYHCPNCGYEEPSNFGIVRAYLEKHGLATALEISRDTKIPVSEINSFLRNGRLEIPENSDVFIDCKRCGVSIRYGKYCPACAQELIRELNGAFDTSTIGVKPKTDMRGKMHSSFLMKNRL